MAAKKRSKRLLTETDEYIANNVEGTPLDADVISAAYQKMTSLCMNIKNEIYTDIEIHNQHILPRHAFRKLFTSRVLLFCNKTGAVLIMGLHFNQQLMVLMDLSWV